LKTYTKAEINDLNFTSDSIFEDLEFDGIDFTSYDLKSVAFFNCKFTNCNLANLSLTDISIRETTFLSCNLIGINWCNLRRFEAPKFLDSKLNFSIFQGLKLKKIEIINCFVIDADFSEADLSHSNFSNSNFKGTNFDKAILIGTDFRTSLNYMFDIRTTKIKGAKFTFPHVISLLTALGAEVDIS